MKHISILVIICLLNFISIRASEIVNINGSFEKVQANSQGFVSPRGWVKDKTSKGVKFSATNEEVKSGKFSLYIEADENSKANIYYFDAFIKAKANQTVNFTLYAKGEGSFRVGAIAYSNEEKSRFLKTVAAKARKITDDENWQKFSFVLPITKQKRNGKEYTTFKLRPVIIVNGAGEFVIDDLTYEIKESKQ